MAPIEPSAPDLGQPAIDAEAVERRLRALETGVDRWGNGAGDRYPAHAHGYDKILVVTEGDVTFLLGDGGRALTLHAGDRLDLPAGTRHAAVVGDRGVRCLEAHLPPGRLGSHPRRVAGWALGAPGPGSWSPDETADGAGT